VVGATSSESFSYSLMKLMASQQQQSIR